MRLVARAICGLLILLLVSAAVAAPQQPRDARRSESLGTAAITGTVVGADADAHPIGRALVTISGAELPSNRTTSSDDDGRFAFRELPAGRFTIVTAKRGYVAGAHGATRPGRAGTPVALAAGQQLQVRIVMSRGGVLTGAIRDDRGQPIPDLFVFAVETRLMGASPLPQSRTALRPTDPVRTDDRGVYRLFDLGPGEYVVVAAANDSGIGNSRIARRADSEVDAILSRLGQRATTSARSDQTAATRS